MSLAERGSVAGERKIGSNPGIRRFSAPPVGQFTHSGARVRPDRTPPRPFAPTGARLGRTSAPQDPPPTRGSSRLSPRPAKMGRATIGALARVGGSGPGHPDLRHSSHLRRAASGDRRSPTPARKRPGFTRSRERSFAPFRAAPPLVHPRTFVAFDRFAGSAWRESAPISVIR